MIDNSGCLTLSTVTLLQGSIEFAMFWMSFSLSGLANVPQSQHSNRQFTGFQRVFIIVVHAQGKSRPRERLCMCRVYKYCCHSMLLQAL